MIRFFILILVSLFSSCNFSDDTKNLSGGWTFASESKDGKVIVKGEKRIPCKVTQYGFNNDFIIAIQRVVQPCFIGIDSIDYPEGADKSYYWIVIHEKDTLLGPLTEKDFALQKINYHIPEFDFERTE